MEICWARQAGCSPSKSSRPPEKRSGLPEPMADPTYATPLLLLAFRALTPATPSLSPRYDRLQGTDRPACPGKVGLCCFRGKGWHSSRHVVRVATVSLGRRQRTRGRVATQRDVRLGSNPTGVVPWAGRRKGESARAQREEEQTKTNQPSQSEKASHRPDFPCC